MAAAEVSRYTAGAILGRVLSMIVATLFVGCIPVPAMQWGTCFGYILGILDGTGQLECSDIGRPSQMVNIGIRDLISALKRHIQKSPGGLPESAKDLVQEAWTAELCPRAGVE